ncbi:MAG: CapA family protein [Eubacteriales bacterium]|nr:CapA family protein [Eubacteriales bacterium]
MSEEEKKTDTKESDDKKKDSSEQAAKFKAALRKMLSAAKLQLIRFLKFIWKYLKEFVLFCIQLMAAAWERFHVYFIRSRKKNLRMKKKLDSKEYLVYRIRRIPHDLKYAIPALAGPVLILLAAIFLVRGVISAGHSLMGRNAGRETEEIVLETETETEKVYAEADLTVGSTGCMLLHSPFIDSYPDQDGNYDFSSIFKYITPYYSKPDFMTCEFEGSLGGEELGYSGYPMFISPDIIIQNLRDSGIDLQYLASNHIYDGMSYGFHRTMDVYNEHAIAFSGIRESKNDKQYYVADVNGVRLGFLDYVYETVGEGTNLNGIPLEAQDADLVNSFDSDDLESFYKEVEANIVEMKSVGVQFIIMQMHWGIEYQLTESEEQDAMAQRLCDLGVGAVIGGHPHCEQPIDLIMSKDQSHAMFCIYSEGNALSNQRTYLLDEMPTGHTEDGSMITLHLHRDTAGNVTITDVELLPTWVYRYQDTSGSKYFILPLDDVDSLPALTGIKDLGQDPANSYQRTMEVLGGGLEKANNYFHAQNQARIAREQALAAETETGSETEEEGSAK